MRLDSYNFKEIFNFLNTIIDIYKLRDILVFSYNPLIKKILTN